MNKSAASRKFEMQSDLTEPEMDAALQLIQLSGDSVASGGGTTRTAEQSREESVGDSNEISSYNKIFEIDSDALPRRKKRFRSIGDIYSVTSPAAGKRRKKSVRR